MASIAMMAGGAIINSLAFSGTNFIFSKLGDRGAEIERHNRALEAFTKARDSFNKERAQRLDFLNQTLRRERHAEVTFDNLAQAGRDYYNLTKKTLPPLHEPVLSDFYKPSRDYKNSELLVVTTGMILVAVVAYKYNK